MATSGKFTTTIRAGFFLDLEWRTVSQNIANNTSSVEAKLYFRWEYSVSSSASKSAKISINGSQGNYSFVIGSGSSGNRLIGTRTVTVAHNSDGTKSTAISGSAAVNLTLRGTYYGTVSVSGTAVLNTIPRASAITGASNVSVNGSNACSVTIDRKSGGFTHTVKWSIGSYSFTRTGVATSTSYVIPMDWLRSIPNAISGSAKVEVTTYSGSTKIGNTVSRSFTISAPANVVPTISNVTATRVNNSVPSAWAEYVQGQSGCTVAIVGAAGTYGSTIKSFQITGHGINATSASTTFNLGGSGTMTFTGRVTDSRGRTTTGTVQIVVQPWKSPEITSVDLARSLSTGVLDDDGTYGRAVTKFDVSSVNGKNLATTLIEYRIKGSTTWVSGGAFTNDLAKVFGDGGISLNNTYDVQITVKDQFVTTTWVGFLSTAFTTMDFKAGGHGIAFGKVSEKEDVFETAFPIEMTGGLNYVLMPVSSDFNDYTKPGFYYNPRSADVGGFTNRPGGGLAGSLEVKASAEPGCVQYWYEYYNPNGSTFKVWKRGFYNGDWSPWYLVDQGNEYKLLWGVGGTYMNGDQTVNLSENVSSQKTGIVLCWSAYDNGSAANNSWSYQFIPKWHVAFAPGTAVYTIMEKSGGIQMQKYVYVHDNRITGNNSNVTSPNNNRVLRAVLGV